MLRKKYSQTVIRALAALLLISTVPATNAQIQYWGSALGRYQAYIDPWTDGNGERIGIRVHYSLGGVYDYQSGNTVAPYAAVCVMEGYIGPGDACVNHDARVWTKSTSYYYPGYWVTQYIPLDCDNIGLSYAQVHQPYTSAGSSLNFHVSGGSPYQGSQLFYSGTSDTANVQFGGCQMVYR